MGSRRCISGGVRTVGRWRDPTADRDGLCVRRAPVANGSRLRLRPGNGTAPRMPGLRDIAGAIALVTCGRCRHASGGRRRTDVGVDRFEGITLVAISAEPTIPANQLKGLDGVEGGSLADVIGDYPDGKAVLV